MPSSSDNGKGTWVPGSRLGSNRWDFDEGLKSKRPDKHLQEARPTAPEANREHQTLGPNIPILRPRPIHAISLSTD